MALMHDKTENSAPNKVHVDIKSIHKTMIVSIDTGDEGLAVTDGVQGQR